jgi:MFS family permease
MNSKNKSKDSES